MEYFDQGVRRFLDECLRIRRLSPHTVRAYDSDLRQFFAGEATALNNAGFTAESIRERLAALRSNTRFAPSTIRRHAAAVKSFLHWADIEMARSAFGDWKFVLPRGRRLPKTVAVPELTVLVRPRESAPQSEATTRLAIALLTITGLRIAELCGLCIGQFRPATGEIFVRGKGSKERVVIVGNALIRQAIIKHIENAPDPGDFNAPLLRNQRGRRMSPQCFRLRLHALARRCGIQRRVTPHMFRHTAATLLLEAGVDIRYVQKLLGHASIGTTEIYTHVSDTALFNAVRRADVMNCVL